MFLCCWSLVVLGLNSGFVVLFVVEMTLNIRRLRNRNQSLRDLFGYLGVDLDKGM